MDRFADVGSLDVYSHVPVVGLLFVVQVIEVELEARQVVEERALRSHVSVEKIVEDLVRDNISLIIGHIVMIFKEYTEYFSFSLNIITEVCNLLKNLISWLS